MTPRSIGAVIAKDARPRVDLPALLTGLFGAGVVVGLATPVRRRVPWLVWGSLAGALTSGAALAAALRAVEWEVTVGERGVQLVRGAGQKVDIGVPAAVRQGRCDTPVAGGLLGVPIWWVALETDAGKVVLFKSAVGIFGSGYGEWPMEEAPPADDTYSGLGFDLASFRAALWTAMLR